MKKFIILSTSILIFLSYTGFSQDLSKFVNPFIGTSNAGNTHPGAVLPWGTASVVPHNTYKGPTPYIHGEKYLLGFGNLQLSGVGCPETGSILLRPTHGDLFTDVEKGKSTYIHEQATPGYYSTFLETHHILAQMTATQRSGRSKYTYPKGKNHLIIDLGTTQSHIKGGLVEIISDNEIRGYKNEGNFCDSRLSRKTFFYIKIIGPASKTGLFNGTQLITDKTISGEKVGAYLSYNFAKETSIEVLVGISFVSIENAKQNLEAEQPKDKSFKEIKNLARKAWNTELSKVKVKDDADTNKTKFYTALYHTLIHPMVYNDVNHDYLTMQTEDQKERFVKKTDYTRYSVFSLWDTYRTVHPLFTLLYPKQQRDMTQSMIDMYKEGKWLPKWELFGQESWVMVGDPASIVIADTYLKGIKDIDIKSAYEGMLKSGSYLKSQNYLRPGLKEYLKYGYIPIDKRGGADSTLFSFNNGYVWGPVSTSQEYYLSDFNISRIAKALGFKDDEKTYLERSNNFTTLFDDGLKFFRPKNSNGTWLTPFNPLDRTFDIRWEKSGGHGYVEGTAWIYRFFVPHNPQKLIALFGGNKPFKDSLDLLFSKKYFDITNEPDISYPYLYNYIEGEENNTSTTVHHIIDHSYSTKPGGIPGNDDAGTLSGWLVFAMSGIYPDCPGIPVYQISVPKFKKVILNLSQDYWSSDKLTIQKIGEGIKIKEIWLDGKKLTSFSVKHEDLVKAKKLTIKTF
ncbi:GH92 family glycosyl hydrolase [Pedobacter glucosidilyticus]|uniref:GH92 family glycosyl hydrolase n=1 Tax=Pedobacter glucosidilyticus TaxID=1122941 RepID=UPI0004219FE6|nr:GH92 family glycosyl hydrolase [Pedobacter glucosidilyticus]